MKSCLLSVFAMLFVASTLNAQLVWDGTSSPWTQGTGTETDPYLIETPQNLAWLSDMVNNGVSTYSGVYFKQIEDFNMNNILFDCIGAQNSFNGHYDGNFNSISNLVISDLSNYLGLFGNTANATLRGICVRGIRGNGMSNNKLYVGAICGKSHRDTILQCSCIGDVLLQETSYNSSFLNIGGLIGYASFSVVEECFVKGNVRSERYYNICYIGGIIGHAYSYTSSSSVADPVAVKSSYFIGDIIVTGNNYGYDVGYAGLLIGCYYTDNMRDIYDYYPSNNSHCIYSVYNCYAIGDFTASRCNNSYVIIGGHTIPTNYQWYFYHTIMSNNNSYCGNNLASSSQYATNRTEAYMKSVGCPSILNMGLDSTVFYYDSLNVNDGYPIFWYQKPIKYWVNATYDHTQGTVTGMGSYASGTTATLRAMPAEGYIFSGWSDGSTENPRTVTVTGYATYTANFTKNAYNIYIKQDCTVEVE